MEPKKDEFVNKLQTLINDANELLAPIIEKIKNSDERARLHNSHWSQRHRLLVLLDETNRILENSIVPIDSPLFVAELQDSITIIRKWSKDPLWIGILPSLVNSDHFTHTIAKLHIASHFQETGYKVEIIPRGNDASPDLRVQARGETDQWLYIECYQPEFLNGKPIDLTIRRVNTIVENCMSKARKQIANRHGILALCTIHQSNSNIQILVAAIKKRLEETKRTYLAGIALVSRNVLHTDTRDEFSFQPVISFELISNPAYFGVIDIKSDDSANLPNRIVKGRLVDLEGTPFKVVDPSHDYSPISSNVTPKEEKLRIIESPNPIERTMGRSPNKKVIPLYKGKGNINFLCGSCNACLVENSWQLSLTNFVLQCPLCNSFNEIPMQNLEGHQVTRVAFSPGYFDSDVSLDLHRNFCFEGIGKDAVMKFKKDMKTTR